MRLEIELRCILEMFLHIDWSPPVVSQIPPVLLLILFTSSGGRRSRPSRLHWTALNLVPIPHWLCLYKCAFCFPPLGCWLLFPCPLVVWVPMRCLSLCCVYYGSRPVSFYEVYPRSFVWVHTSVLYTCLLRCIKNPDDVFLRLSPNPSNQRDRQTAFRKLNGLILASVENEDFP